MRDHTEDLDIHPGNGEDTDLHMIKLADGNIMMLPRSLRRHQDRETQEAISDLQHLALEMQKISMQIDELVPILREMGVSWGGIGWCVNMTENGAAKRWGNK